MSEKQCFYYENGTLAVVKEEGQHQRFSREGTLRLVEEYREGRLHGVTRLFSKTGKLLREVHYREGKRSGAYTVYSEEGKVLEEGSFIDDIPTGTHRLFSLTGALLEEVYYHDGDRFDKRVFREDGLLHYEGVYDDQMVYTETRVDAEGKTTVRKGKWLNRQLHF